MANPNSNPPPDDRACKRDTAHRNSSVVLYLSTFLITWYSHLNNELILFIRSI